MVKLKQKKKISALLVAFTFVFATFFMPVSVQAQTFKGVDVYEYDNISNYQQLKDTGVQVIIQKATEGLTYNDSLLQYRYAHIQQYGFKIGYYHYARNNNPIAEAQHFLAQIKGLRSDTVLWLDIENENDWSKQEAIDYTNQFINYVQGQGYKIGLYTGLSFYYEYLQGNISNVPLWLASYGRQPLQYPDTVSWQSSGTGQLNGVAGNIDLDSFNDNIFLNVQTVTSNVTAQNSPQVTSWGGYNISKVKSLQHLINNLGIANLNEDGKLGTKTLNAMSKLPIAQINGYHNTAYTVWLESQFGETQDGIYYTGLNCTVRSFQHSHCLQVDGKVGINTLKKLLY